MSDVNMVLDVSKLSEGSRRRLFEEMRHALNKEQSDMAVAMADMRAAQGITTLEAAEAYQGSVYLEFKAWYKACSDLHMKMNAILQSDRKMAR